MSRHRPASTQEITLWKFKYETRFVVEWLNVSSFQKIICSQIEIFRKCHEFRAFYFHPCLMRWPTKLCLKLCIRMSDLIKALYTVPFSTWSDFAFWKVVLGSYIILWATNAPPTLSFYSTGGFYKLYLLIVKIRNASVKKPSVPSCIICQYGGHLVCIDWSSLGPLLDNVVPPWPIMATVTWTQHNDPPT